MCGIFALWDPEQKCKIDPAQITQDLWHRGPDFQSFKINLDSKLTLFHARLKIIDTSEVANQPFVSDCGRWSLVFNGEIYNYKEIKREIGNAWNWKKD